MSQPRVYVETTIPSFYYDTRTTPDIVARRAWTREWWSTASELYELVTSAVVIGELRKGPVDRSIEWLSLIDKLPQLDLDPAIADILSVYHRNHLMPADPSCDGLHLALASFHRCDFLVTWNCRHLANANKFGHIRRVNVLLNLSVPSLVTRLELLGVYDDPLSA